MRSAVAGAIARGGHGRRRHDDVQLHPVKAITTGEGGMVDDRGATSSPTRSEHFGRTESPARDQGRRPARRLVLRDRDARLQLPDHGLPVRAAASQLARLDGSSRAATRSPAGTASCSPAWRDRVCPPSRGAGGGTRTTCSSCGSRRDAQRRKRCTTSSARRRSVRSCTTYRFQATTSTGRADTRWTTCPRPGHTTSRHCRCRCSRHDGRGRRPRSDALPPRARGAAAMSGRSVRERGRWPAPRSCWRGRGR